MFVRKSNRASHRRALMTTAAVMVGLGAAAAQAATPIDTNQPYYLQSQVGSSVNPDFQGGTLRNDLNNVTDANAYTVENFPTNTIDAFGNKTTFSGGFSGAGPLTITDSKGGGAVVVTSSSAVDGTVTVDKGATLQWGDGTAPASLIGLATGGVVDNGRLVMSFGGGGVGGAVISGTGDVVIQTGSFSEFQTSTYTGSTTIDLNADLYMGPGSSIAASSGVTVTGTFDASGSDTSITTLSGAGTVNLGARTLTLTNASGTFSGQMMDGGIAGGTGGALTIAGGTEILTGTNIYTGTTTINPGATLQLGNGGSTGSVAGAISDNGLLKFDYSGPVTVGNAISGTGSAEVAAGTVIVTSSSTLDGTVTIDQGATLQWGDGTAAVSLFGLATNGVVDNGTLVMNFGGSGLGGAVISGTGDVVVHSGSFSEFQTSTYTGSTTIDPSGYFYLGAGGSISASSGVTANGTFDISGSTAGSITTLSGSGTVKLGAQTLTLTNASGTFSGVMTDGGLGGGTGGGLTIAGGTEILTGTNSYTGTTTINPGATLQLGNGGSTGSVAGAISDNGLLKFDYSGPVTVGNAISGTGSAEVAAGTVIVTSSSTLDGTVTVDQGATLQWGDGTAAVSLFGLATNGVVDNGTLVMNFGGSGLGGAAISGTGDVVVHTGSFSEFQTSTYTGSTAIDPSGYFYLGAGGSISASSGVTANGTFDISGSTAGSITTLSGSGTVKLGAQTLTLTNASGTFSGVISDGGLGGGTGGGLTIAGGSEILTGTNTYTGATTINTGATLGLTGTGSIATSLGVTANGTFDISGTTAGASVMSLAGSGAVNLGAQTLTLTNASGTFSGVIADGGLSGGTGGGLTLAGGTEILAGTNTYTGTTTIDGGATLQLGDGGTTGSVAGDITDNGLLKFDYSGSVTTPGAISGTGSAEVVAGTAVVTKASSISGTVTIDSGATLEWGATPTTVGYLTGAGNGVVDNGTLVVNLNGGGLSGDIPISGSGAVAIQSGSINDYAVSSYTGATSISSGALFLLSNSGSIAQSSGVTANGTFDISGTTAGASIMSLAGSGSVNLGAQTLTLTNASGTFAGVIADGGLSGGTGGGLTLAGGTEILTGANTYTGGTTVGPGATLQLGDGGASGSVVGGVVDNGTLIFNRSDAYVYAGVVSGAGQLVQAGTGTLILNGVNTVSGQTTVSGGVLEIGDATHPGAVLDSHVGGVSVGANGTLAGHGSILGAVTNASGGTVAPGGTIGTLTVGSYTQGAGGTLAIEVSPTAASQLNVLGQASLNGRLALTFDPGTYVPHIYTIVKGAPLTGTFSSVTASGSPADPMAYGLSYTPTQAELLVVPAAPAQVYDGVTTATLDRAQGLASLVEDRFGDAGCADGSVDKKVEACHGMGAWAQAVGTSDNLHAGGASIGFTNGSAGFLGGIDRRWGGGVTVGAAFGYEGEDLSMGGASAHATGSAYFGALYGRWVVDRAFIDGQAFYMHSDWTVNRQLAGFGAARSSPGGNTEGFLLQVSAPIHGDDLRPYARVSYAQFDRSGVTETGVGALGFAVNSATTSSTIGEAGLMFAHSYAGVDGREVRPALRVGLQDAIGDRSRDVQVGLSGLFGPGVTVASASVPKVAGVVDGSIILKLNRSFELTGDLRGRFSGEQTDASASVGGVFRF